MTRLLFGRPGDWASRHPGAMLGMVIVLVLVAEWAADVAASVGGF